jgi:hypothetical protein
MSEQARPRKIEVKSQADTQTVTVKEGERRTSA